KRFDDASNLLEEMEIEARDAPIKYRKEMISKTKQFRQSLDTLRRELSMALNASTLQKLEQQQKLPTGDYASDPRAKLLYMNDTLNATTQGISRTIQVAAETEDIGINVQSELRTQRESLYRTRNYLDETDVQLSRS